MGETIILVLCVYLLAMALGYGLFSYFTALSAKMKMALVGSGGLGHLVGVCGVYVFDKILRPNMTDSTVYFNHATASLGMGIHQLLYVNNSYPLIYIITYWVKYLFSGNSFFATTLMFSTTGFLGSVIYVILFCYLNQEPLRDKLNNWRITFSMVVLMVLPSMLFFTSKIGKDGLLYLCSAITLWSFYQILSNKKSYSVLLLLFILPMIVIRPFLLVVMLAAATLVILLNIMKAKHLLRSILIILALTIIGVFMLDMTSSHFGGVSQSIWAWTKLDAFRAALNKGTSIGIITTNPYMLILLIPYFTFAACFLPLFGAPQSVLGVLASIENMFMLMLVVCCMYYWRTVKALFKENQMYRFLGLYGIIGIAIIGLLIPNLGASMRYKLMFTPAIYLLLLSSFVRWPLPFAVPKPLKRVSI